MSNTITMWYQIRMTGIVLSNGESVASGRKERINTAHTETQRHRAPRKITAKGGELGAMHLKSKPDGPGGASCGDAGAGGCRNAIRHSLSSSRGCGGNFAGVSRRAEMAGEVQKQINGGG